VGNSPNLKATRLGVGAVTAAFVGSFQSGMVLRKTEKFQLSALEDGLALMMSGWCFQVRAGDICGAM